ncbi:unnamed protein product [Parnassius mnemosyne]|uniref:Phospholipid scramblase n=1 Tax=Parnassius mnemosyne TaxID=213953 RepID=A0AAV1LL49_9NEOP
MINSEHVKEEWMPCPKIETDWPGLTFIYPLDEIIIVKKTDVLHQVIGGKGFCYTIFNNQQQKVFIAVQESHKKKYNLKIFNYYGNEVIQVRKPCGLCLNRVLIWAPPGNFVGSVEKIFTCCPTTYLVKNSQGDVVLKIKACKCFKFEYDILANGKKIGKMRNEHHKRNVFKENVAASFPAEIDIGYKAVLIGACFLINFLN